MRLHRSFRYAPLTLALFTRSLATALPTLRGEDIDSKLLFQGLQDLPVVLGDSDSAKVQYMSFDRVGLTVRSSDGRPDISLAYDEKGGLLNIGVVAQLSAASAKSKKQAEQRGLEVLGFPIISGHWFLGLTGLSRDRDLVIASLLSTNDPSVPQHFTVSLDPMQVTYLLHGLTTGAGLGVTYQFQFRAMRQLTRISATLNWQVIQRHIEGLSYLATSGCVVDKLAVPPVLNFFTTESKACNTSFRFVRSLVEELIGKSVIKITKIEGDDKEALGIAQTALAKLVSASLFVPAAPALHSQGPNDAQRCVPSGASSGGILGGTVSASCELSSQTLVYDNDIRMADKDIQYEIQSGGVGIFPGAFGGGLTGICEALPDAIVHVGSGRRGCPP